MALTPEFRKRYDFDWQILDVVISGRSAIDAAKILALKNADEGARFLDAYGYDLDNPIEKAELFGNFQEAIRFIRRYFLKPDNADGLEIEIPRKILEITDITQLLLYVSNNGSAGNNVTNWACVVIKVMHTIAHLDRDLFGSYYFTDVQKQILDRFYRHIHTDENGQIYLGKDNKDPDKVELIAFESKPKKSRDSVILKLLHKPENVAEDIFDRVGIRFVTKNKFDGLRVLKYLKDRYVIMPANIKPSRSRNNLIDVAGFRAGVDDLLAQADAGKITEAELIVKMNEISTPKDREKDKQNPHTSEHYRSLQFTGRHLIKLKNPVYDELKQLKSSVKNKTLPEDVARIIDAIDLKNIQKETRFFYPFEVQVYDEISHQENLAGLSSHANYKKNQVKAAMTRVMSVFMQASAKGEDAKTKE